MGFYGSPNSFFESLNEEDQEKAREWMTKYGFSLTNAKGYADAVVYGLTIGGNEIIEVEEGELEFLIFDKSPSNKVLQRLCKKASEWPSLFLSKFNAKFFKDYPEFLNQAKKFRKEEFNATMNELMEKSMYKQCEQVLSEEEAALNEIKKIEENVNKELSVDSTKKAEIEEKMKKINELFEKEIEE